MAKKNISSSSPPILWSTVDQAFKDINDNFNELYSTIEGGGGEVLDFTNLGTDLIPVNTEQYNLGTSDKKWRQIFVSATYGINIGNAQITASGSAVNLPAGTTIDGSLLDNEYFREIAVAGESNIIANAGGDSILTIASGGDPGITLTTDPLTDTLTITNTGVTGLSGTAGQIGVSGATGNVTLTNLGVLTVGGIGTKSPSLASGSGIHVSNATGNVQITNTGILEVTTYTGSGVLVNTLSPGVIELVNGAPNIPQDVIKNIAVSGQDTIIASSTNYTLTVVEGNSGITLTTNLGSGRLTITNSGVTGITTSGPGISSSSSTGNVNIAFSNEIDIVGSVFSDSSSMLVDGTDGKIVGPVYTSILRTSEAEIALGGLSGGVQGAGSIAIGYQSGGNQGLRSIAIGFQSALTSQGDRAIAIGQTAGNVNQGANGIAIGETAASINQGTDAIAIGQNSAQSGQGANAISIGRSASGDNQGTYAIAIGRAAAASGQSANSIVLNATGTSVTASAAGFYIDPVRSLTNPATVLGYDTSTKEISYSSLIDVDVVGSVFSDGSTMLIDGVDGRIVGPVYTSTLRTSETNIVLGNLAGNENQGFGSIAIGNQSAVSNQGTLAVAIGADAGANSQGADGVSIGTNSGYLNQGQFSIAIGRSSGNDTQGQKALAIGYGAGQTSQGDFSIAIGSEAGQTNQSANSIVINASGSTLNGAAAGFYVDPIRNLSTGNILTYNTTTKEIGYTSLIETDISGSVFADDSTKIIDGTDATITATKVTADGVIGTNYLKAPVYADTSARDTALPGGIVETGMIVFLQSTSKLQINANGTTGGWVDLN